MIAERAEVRASRTVVVSPELTLAIGPVPGGIALPPHAVALVVGVDDGSVRFLADAPEAGDDDSVALLLAPTVFARLDSRFPGEIAGDAFRLPIELRPVVRAMLDCDVSGEAGNLYCAAKAVELLCEIVRRHDSGALLPQAGDGALSSEDTLRILRARKLIDESWRERLTLDRIASHCGVNREKLTRGFRSLFQCSVAEAIAERRLGEAERMLLSTDLPVAAVGYRSGYLNNASFSRAFSRRFGITPRDYRVQRLAA